MSAVVEKISRDDMGQAKDFLEGHDRLLIADWKEVQNHAAGREEFIDDLFEKAHSVWHDTSRAALALILDRKADRMSEETAERIRRGY